MSPTPTLYAAFSPASYTKHTIRYDTVQPAYNTTGSYNEHTIRYDTVQHHTAGTCGRGCGSDNSDVDGMPDGGSTLPQISQDFRSTALRYVHAGHAANTRSQSDRISVSSVVFFLSVCSDRILRLHPRRGWRRVPDSARCIR